MSSARERALFEALVMAWNEYINDEDGNLDGMLDALHNLGEAMGFEWREPT